ncbi:hypothetical protein EJB05_51998 [Eragrostis curvula]|uniref:Embryo surrounding factor 1 brassicaceae domain-containing protein n=1 Tax=Eragrostis curvula TaxID=38414 RepID=A0A5J9SU44_9POAL|nr:hypothetical protein EJB05_51998 [Eragrostis curvula]
MKVSGAMVYAAPLFTFVLLSAAASGQCRPNLLGAETSSKINISSNVTAVASPTLEDNKLNLIFCEKTICGKFPWVTCYCCRNHRPKQVCYYKLDECRSDCPVCNPHCPP